MSHHVYGIHERDTGRLLYIGCTNRPARRSSEHHKRFGDALLRVWASFHHRQDAENYETRLIRTLEPPHNKVGGYLRGVQHLPHIPLGPPVEMPSDEDYREMRRRFVARMGGTS